MNGMGQVTVRLSDGREFRAIEVLTDPKADIAVVRIEGVGDLLASPMGNSDRSEIGDWVLALGQPFGLESTVTAGIISAKQRGIGVNERESYIQTDAAINPGNSGGPLVNLNGEVIGINTAISSRSGGNEGIGFAIPINQARWIGNQLMEHGKVRRSYMGVGVQELTAPLATQFGVPPRSGLVVTLVQPDSPADRAGLQTGDVLVSFDGSPVNEPAELQLIVERCEPGQKKSLEILRGAEHSRLSVVPAELVDDVAVDEVREAAVPVAVQPTSEIGLRVEAIDPEIAQQTGISDGVVVTAIAIGSPAQQAGLEPGVVISEVNHQRIRGIEDFATAIRRADPSSGILMLVEGPEGSRYLVLKTAS
jgi:serine protease Do